MYHAGNLMRPRAAMQASATHKGGWGSNSSHNGTRIAPQIRCPAGSNLIEKPLRVFLYDRLQFACNLIKGLIPSDLFPLRINKQAFLRIRPLERDVQPIRIIKDLEA